MATLQEIRKRIVGVEKTQKLTKAMKTVSAAKLGRATARDPRGSAVRRDGTAGRTNYSPMSDVEAQRFDSGSVG